MSSSKIIKRDKVLHPSDPQDPQRVVAAVCTLSFDAFAHRAFEIIRPGTLYEWNWHIGCIAAHLDACYRGEIRRLIINIPPRCLKSYLVGEAFPAWVMGKEPHRKFIIASCSRSLALDRAENCRRIMNSAWYKLCFPTVQIDRTHNQKENFETTQYGGYYAAGIGGTIVGKGADYVILDDPLKPNEALSQTIRDNTNEAIRSTLFSRMNDPRKGCFIMIMQRLHEDDPSGHLLSQNDNYHLLKLPAIAKRGFTVFLEGKQWRMDEGQYLFPSRLTPEVLEEKRNEMDDIVFSGQYLQEPVRIGAGEFRPEWIQRYRDGSLKPSSMNIVIVVDPASGEESNRKKKKSTDWTAMMVVGLGTDNNYYLLDIIRDRLNPTERVDMLFLLHRKWNTLCGKPPKVGYERYGMMTDTHYIREKMTQDSYHLALIEVGGSMEKTDRIRRLIPDMQTGRWFFPDTLMYVDQEGRQFDLVKELMYSEMTVFPRGRFDDMLDALSRIHEPELMLSFPTFKKPRLQNTDSYDQDWRNML